MLAVRLFAPGDVRCVEVDVPRVESPGTVIVKVHSCGVCGSDIARVMVKGAYSYPIAEAAKVAMKTVVSFLREEVTSLKEVSFVLFDSGTYESYQSALKELSL